MTLVFTAWAIGGYNDWALHLLFLGGLLTFSFSIAPMPITWNGYDRRHSFEMNIKRLLRLPFFWLGVVFLVYIFIQYINPSVELVRGEGSWWVESISPPLGRGFPSSVKADYSEMNALRALVIHGAALMTVWGILVGIQRRKSALITVWAFVLSGTLMGFIAILQKFTAGDPNGPQYILWFIESSNPNLWGTFMYRNQGAAFLILTLIVSGVLYFFYLKRDRMGTGNGAPHFFFYFTVILLSGSVWLALSRGGIVLGFFLLAVFILFSGIKFIKHFRFGVSSLSGAIFIPTILLGVVFFSQFSDWREIERRAENFKANIESSESYDRILSTKATLDMGGDRFYFGWGAGSFRYIFPVYQRNYDAIWYHHKHPRKGWKGRRYYEYAHNDWAQFLAEYGIVGLFIIGLLLLNLIKRILEGLKVTVPGIIFATLGILVIFFHNLFDFIFSSPAYWVAFWGSMMLLSKLLSLEAKLHRKKV